MVSTRLQTGAISRKHTPLSISIQDLSLGSSPPSPTRQTKRKNGPNSPTKIIKSTSPRPSRKISLRPSGLPKQKTTRNALSLTNAEMTSLDAALRHSVKRASTPSMTNTAKQTIPEDMCPGNAIFPSASFGAREEVGLSKIARADKNIKRWEEILLMHQQNVPTLAPLVEERLQEAKDKRAKIDDKLEENIRVGDVDPIASKIKARLEILQWALSTSKFGPEGDNIKCAIAGYESGAITHSKHFTIIYAGKIVDTAPTYDSFIVDRSARLDRYFALHGEGWIWYEPPLNVHPSTKPTALASAALQRAQAWSALGCYQVNQGFWKRSGFVRRMAATLATSLADNELYFNRNPLDPMEVDCQLDGPRLSFWSLLDSGATFPSLHTEDLIALGIDQVNYAAQCVDEIVTANGPSKARIWELFVCVLDDDGKQLVDPSNAVWPNSHVYLGGLCPCIESLNPMEYDENGFEIANRLSGMLPFVSCYVSTAPTRDYLFLGEDRNDVLGSHRIPGQKKWRIDLPPITPGMPFDRYRNPKSSFDHRKGMITDVDHPDIDHVSTITFLKGTPNEVVIVSNPGNRT